MLALRVNVAAHTSRLSFDLSGLWSIDDVGQDILIKGVLTGNSGGRYTAFQPFTMANGLKGGLATRPTERPVYSHRASRSTGSPP